MSETTSPTARQIRNARAAFEQVLIHDQLADMAQTLADEIGTKGTPAYYVLTDEISRHRQIANELRDDISTTLGECFDEYL